MARLSQVIDVLTSAWYEGCRVGLRKDQICADLNVVEGTTEYLSVDRALHRFVVHGYAVRHTPDDADHLVQTYRPSTYFRLSLLACVLNRSWRGSWIPHVDQIMRDGFVHDGQGKLYTRIVDHLKDIDVINGTGSVGVDWLQFMPLTGDQVREDIMSRGWTALYTAQRGM